MFRHTRHVITALAVLPSFVAAIEPTALSKDTYKTELGVIVLQVNWGQTWDCGQFENAQLQALTFSQIGKSGGTSLELKPSSIFSKNVFIPYAYIVPPGKYFLTTFDVKVTSSVNNIFHIKGDKDNLVKDSKPIGGSFNVNPGEIVYLGHFGLDCAAEPFLWRYYIEGRDDFERYIEGFREQYPFVREIPVQYRLFTSQMFGNSYSLQNPTVK